MDKPALMPCFRFSLLALFGFVAIIAVGCASLARPSELWEIGISAVGLVLLVFAVLAAIYGQRAARTFWSVFAIIGWAYIGAQYFGLTDQLPTTRIAHKLQTALHPEHWAPNGFGDIALINQQELYSFQLIARWLWPMILGFVGGLVGRHLYLRRERERAMPKN